jgi:hypothetical protein
MTTLRIKGKAKVIEWRPSDRQKIESATFKFVAQISDYYASRGVAFPDSVELNFPDGSRQKFSRTKAALTKRQKEILRESGRPIFLDFLKSIAKSEDESADIEKAKKVYEKMVFGGGPSEKKRAASEFLRRWDNARLYDKESLIPEAISLIGPMRMIYLTPLLNALNAHDPEFVEALAGAMKMSHSERDKVRKRLIEVDELVHPTGPRPTWRAIWRKHCPDHKDSPQNFQKLLRECGIPFEGVGEFRGNGRKRVRKRKKNTHRARCKLAAVAFTAADAREVQARARRPALVDTRAGKGS